MNDDIIFTIENAWIEYNAAIVSHAGKNNARERLANILITNTPAILEALKVKSEPVTGDVGSKTGKKSKSANGVG